MQPGTENCYRHLAVSIVLQAFRDIHEANGRADEAELWLKNGDAQLYLDTLNLDAAKIEGAISYTKRLKNRGIRLNWAALDKVVGSAQTAKRGR